MTPTPDLDVPQLDGLDTPIRGVNGSILPAADSGLIDSAEARASHDASLRLLQRQQQQNRLILLTALVAFVLLVVIAIWLTWQFIYDDCIQLNATLGSNMDKSEACTWP